MKPNMLLADIRSAADKRNTRVEREGTTAPHPSLKSVATPPPAARPPLSNSQNRQQQLVQEAMKERLRRQQARQEGSESQKTTPTKTPAPPPKAELVFLPHTAEIVANAQTKHKADMMTTLSSQKVTHQIVDGRYDVTLCNEKIFLPPNLRHETLRYYYGKHGGSSSSEMFLNAIKRHNIWLPNMEEDVQAFWDQKNGTAVREPRSVQRPVVALATPKQPTMGAPALPATTSTISSPPVKVDKRQQARAERQRLQEEKRKQQLEKQEQQKLQRQQKLEQKKKEQLAKQEQQRLEKQQRQELQRQKQLAKQQQMRKQKEEKERFINKSIKFEYTQYRISEPSL